MEMGYATCYTFQRNGLHNEDGFRGDGLHNEYTEDLIFCFLGFTGS